MWPSREKMAKPAKMEVLQLIRATIMASLNEVKGLVYYLLLLLLLSKSKFEKKRVDVIAQNFKHVRMLVCNYENILQNPAKFSSIQAILDMLGKTHMRSIHLISESFPKCGLLNSSNAGLTDEGPFWSCPARPSYAASFYASLLQAIAIMWHPWLCVCK